MTDRLPSIVGVAILGHAGLILSIVADFFRRSSEGGWFLIFSVGGSAALIFGGFLFIRHPGYFFFCDNFNFLNQSSASLGWCAVAWILVIGIPVLWLILIGEMQGEGSFGLGARLISGYIIFAWVAVTTILWPMLFARH